MVTKVNELMALPQEGMETQTYLCVDLKTRTADSHMTAGEMREGALIMVDDFHFEFNELSKPAYTRNPIVWSGDYINVHLNKENCYTVHFKRLNLFSGYDTWGLAILIHHELQAAREALVNSL